MKDADLLKYTPRSLAKGTGDIVLSKIETDIGGNCLVSYGRPTTINLVLSGFKSNEFLAHHLQIS